jgi:hypothetical protein
MIADRRLYLDAEGRLVEDGDPRAASLLVAPGQELPDAEAERLGVKPHAGPEPHAEADEDGPHRHRKPKK